MNTPKGEQKAVFQAITSIDITAYEAGQQPRDAARGMVENKLFFDNLHLTNEISDLKQKLAIAVGALESLYSNKCRHYQASLESCTCVRDTLLVALAKIRGGGK